MCLPSAKKALYNTIGQPDIYAKTLIVMTTIMTISDLTNNDFSLPHFANQLDTSFAAINWQAPWLCHLNQLHYLTKTINRLSSKKVQQDSANHFADQDYPRGIVEQVLNKALNQQSAFLQSSLPKTKATANNQAHVVEFVSQNALPKDMGYEQFIANTGKIPTRDNLHDLFNGSIWLTFPKTKAVLNYYHMLEIAKQSDEPANQKSRGRVRDTITVFDENGAVLVTADPIIGEALTNFDWQASLINPRANWDNPHQPQANSQATVYIFGHALLEQLIQPRKPLCAHSIVINVSQDFFGLLTAERIIYLDDKLAKYMDDLLSQDTVTPRQLAPLPILGVPHFWPENSDSSFYDDNFVFRSGRHR